MTPAMTSSIPTRPLASPANPMIFFRGTAKDLVLEQWPRISHDVNPHKAVLDSFGLMYEPDGSPSPLARACQRHFRDRFREVVKRAAEMVLHANGTLPKIEVAQEDGPWGRRLMLTASFTEGVRGSLSLTEERSLEARMLTPTMSRAEALLLRGELALGGRWGEIMKDWPWPLAAFHVETTRDSLVLRAAWLTHLPTDGVLGAALNRVRTHQPLPESWEQEVERGELRLREDHILMIVRRGVAFAPFSWEHMEYAFWAEDGYDARVWQIMEAASSRSASVEALIELAQRLNFPRVGVSRRADYYRQTPDLARRVCLPPLREELKEIMEAEGGELLPEGPNGELKLKLGEGGLLTVKADFEQHGVAGLTLRFEATAGSWFMEQGSFLSAGRLASEGRVDLDNPANVRAFLAEARQEAQEWVSLLAGVIKQRLDQYKAA